jgi:hypothetical protein
MDIFKKASKGVYTSTNVVSPAPSSPTPSTSSVMKTPENTDEDPYLLTYSMEQSPS